MKLMTLKKNQKNNVYIFKRGMPLTRCLSFSFLRGDWMTRYVYDGPVMEFDALLTDRWHGETVAKTKTKAMSNLAYQFKKNHGRLATAKITLPGQIKEAC